jgi:hypothetical protein
MKKCSKDLNYFKTNKNYTKTNFTGINVKNHFLVN